MDLNDGTSKKISLEELSKDDLIKKCRSLISIAQKAKQCKDSLTEEVSTLKHNLAHQVTRIEAARVNNEVLENLTQQKLDLVVSLDEMKHKNSVLENKLNTCESKIADLDTENQSYKRQVQRLTDENEQLISHLDVLEKQIGELKNIGLQQQSQLLDLEKNNIVLSETNNKIIKELNASNLSENETKVSELQSMLSISLDEVNKLQALNAKYYDEIGNIQVVLSEKDKNISMVSGELTSKAKIIEGLVDDLAKVKECEKQLVLINKKLEGANLELMNKQKQFEETSETIITNLNEKLQSKDEEMDDLGTELHRNRALVETLNQDMFNKSNKLSDNQIVSSGVASDLENVNEKLKEKVKLCHSKIVKFAKELRTLKENKNEILVCFKSYAEQVNIWEQQLAELTPKIVIEIENLNCERKKLILKNESYKENVIRLQDENSKLEEDNQEIKKSENRLKTETDDMNTKLKEIQTKNDALLEKITLQTQENCLLKEENNRLSENSDSIGQKLKQDTEEIIFLQSELQKREVEIEEIRGNVQELTRQQVSLKNEIQETSKNKSIIQINSELEQKLLDCQKIKDDQVTEVLILKETVTAQKQENSELLAEMNEMNQVLKKRGETISQQQAYCDEMIKKVQNYELQTRKNSSVLSEKEEIIIKLEQELNSVKNLPQDAINNTISSTIFQKDEEIKELQGELDLLRQTISDDVNYPESETMSSSTFSRTEEISRLKDLEGSWEERYGKLRSLAVKLKGKIRDLTSELSKEENGKAELQQKLANNHKTMQSLQSQCDRLQDDLDSSKAEAKSYLKKLDSVALDISKDKTVLAANEESIISLKSEIDALNKEKSNTETWKKQVSSKIQTLKRELEANVVLKKDYENQISKLKTDIEAKDKELKEEIEKHKQTKSSLQESANECKKKSVLNLEMQDYERSVKDLTQKLDKKQDLVTQLKNQLDSQKTTVNAIKEQNRLLEERFEAEEAELNAARTEGNGYKKKNSDLEALITQKEEKIHSLTIAVENTRLENEELSTQLSKVIAEHQKTNGSLKGEKDLLRSQNLGLEHKLREVQDVLKLKDDELRTIQQEYTGYKVRAQSVLRQNQTRDVGLEEKLLEGAESLKAQLASLTTELSESKSVLETIKKENESLIMERNDLKKVTKNLDNDLQDQKKQYELLTEKHQKTLAECSETVRGLKIHAETLAQCYRQQLSEQEVRHNREVIELQGKIEKSSVLPDTTTFALPMMAREEGEGSESVDSFGAPGVHLVPLEKLLSLDSESDVSFIKKLLHESEAKVSHLTDLLADTEQDLAKHVQMNNLLKEEIRRQQRSVEREEHAENLEYLKNVVFKFVTLSSGDERTRLVPVLNTILKLSPEETHKLNSVAKGDPGIRGWTNYLPLTWSSTNKPQ